MGIGSWNCGDWDVPWSSVSWRTREASGVIQSESEDLRTWARDKGNGLTQAKSLRTGRASGMILNWKLKVIQVKSVYVYKLHIHRYQFTLRKAWKDSYQTVIQSEKAGVSPRVQRSKNEELWCWRAERKDIPAVKNAPSSAELRMATKFWRIWTFGAHVKENMVTASPVENAAGGGTA